MRGVDSALQEDPRHDYRTNWCLVCPRGALGGDYQVQFTSEHREASRIQRIRYFFSLLSQISSFWHDKLSLCGFLFTSTSVKIFVLLYGCNSL